jgi:hypothetical protein
MAQCAGIKRDGGRCTVAVGPGQTHCYQHDPRRSQERKRNASLGGRSKGQGELGELKRRIRSLAAEVLDGTVDRGRATVAGQLYNCLIRALEQERKQRELEELAGRWDELESLLAAAEERITYGIR